MFRSDSPLEERPPTLVDERLILLTLPVVAASAVYVAYLLTHPYPAYGAGLFLETAERIAANGYWPPARIPGYTAGGIPFAYPPLAFYVLAVLIDGAGVDPIAVARMLPGLLVLMYLVPFYGLASELTASPRRASLATLILATAPPVLQWHLSAGGVVRAMAFLFALSSLYAGLWVFRTHAPRWVALAAVTFALVVLTHPTYAVYVVMSYLLLYVGVDRSLRGLASGAVVGFGGLVLVAPWLLHVAAVHGIDIFLTASGTHGGLGSGPRELWHQLISPFLGGAVQWPFYLVVYLGGLYALWKRRWLLPAWLLVTAFMVEQNRFLFVPGSILAATFVFDAVVPAVRDRTSAPSARRVVPTILVGAVALAAVTAGTLYGAGAVPGIRGDGAAQPQFMEAADHEAMEWAAENTPPDATFVVLGDAAEWFPYVSDRTILIGPWGVEWKDTNDYYDQYGRLEAVSVCRNADCLSRSIDTADGRPDYVYVPKGRYTVYDQPFVQGPTMPASLADSDDFRVAFENEGVVIAEVVDGESAS